MRSDPGLPEVSGLPHRSPLEFQLATRLPRFEAKSFPRSARDPVLSYLVRPICLRSPSHAEILTLDGHRELNHMQTSFRNSLTSVTGFEAGLSPKIEALSFHL
jgi:hypothetical protein